MGNASGGNALPPVGSLLETSSLDGDAASGDDCRMELERNTQEIETLAQDIMTLLPTSSSVEGLCGRAGRIGATGVWVTQCVGSNRAIRSPEGRAVVKLWRQQYWHLRHAHARVDVE